VQLLQLPLVSKRPLLLQRKFHISSSVLGSDTHECLFHARKSSTPGVCSAFDQEKKGHQEKKERERKKRGRNEKKEKKEQKKKKAIEKSNNEPKKHA
jgi:hypothetical protein